MRILQQHKTMWTRALMVALWSTAVGLCACVPTLDGPVVANAGQPKVSLGGRLVGSSAPAEGAVNRPGQVAPAAASDETDPDPGQVATDGGPTDGGTKPCAKVVMAPLSDAELDAIIGATQWPFDAYMDKMSVEIPVMGTVPQAAAQLLVAAHLSGVDAGAVGDLAWPGDGCTLCISYDDSSSPCGALQGAGWQGQYLMTDAEMPDFLAEKREALRVVETALVAMLGGS